jgi:hypothetical protein
LTMILEKSAPSSVPIELLTGDTLNIKIHTCVIDTPGQATCPIKLKSAPPLN